MMPSFQAWRQDCEGKVFATSASCTVVRIFLCVRERELMVGKVLSSDVFLFVFEFACSQSYSIRYLRISHLCHISNFNLKTGFGSVVMWSIWQMAHCVLVDRDSTWTR